MISDLKAFLEADAALAALLPVGGSNTKIYYLVPPEAGGGETTPYILLSMQTDGTTDDLIDEGMVNVRVVAEDYETAKAIVDRLTVLLDVQDDCAITSGNHRIFYSKKVGGGSDSQEESTLSFVLARLFHMKYKRITGG